MYQPLALFCVAFNWFESICIFLWKYAIQIVKKYLSMETTTLNELDIDGFIHCLIPNIFFVSQKIIYLINDELFNH